jgi:hypothetical protein
MNTGKLRLFLYRPLVQKLLSKKITKIIEIKLRGFVMYRLVSAVTLEQYQNYELKLQIEGKNITRRQEPSENHKMQ